MEPKQKGVDIEVHGPAGIFGKILNVPAENFLLFVIIIMLGVLMWMIRSSDNDREIRYLGLQNRITEMIRNDKEFSNSQRAVEMKLSELTKEQRVQTYVLTLDERERKLLRLAMPTELRERMR